MRNVIPLARSTINGNATKVDAVFALVDLIEPMISFLTVAQRYRVADRLRDIADQAERVDAAAH